MTQLAAAPEPITLRITGMTCAACQIHVQRALESVPGVSSASVNLMAHTAQITTSAPVDNSTLLTAVHNAGYTASVPMAPMPGMAADSQLMDMDAPRLGLRALLALIAGALAMLLSMPLMMAASSSDPVLNALTRLLAPIMPAALMASPRRPLRWTLCALALGTMLFAAPEIYAAAWRAARHRSTNMNTLIALGTLAAFASSLAATLAPAYFIHHGLSSDVYFEAVIFILAFLLIGRLLEARARARATLALRGFAQLESTEARLLTLDPSDTNPDYNTLPETLLPPRRHRAQRPPPRPPRRPHPPRRHHPPRPLLGRRVHAHRRTPAHHPQPRRHRPPAAPSTSTGPSSSAPPPPAPTPPSLRCSASSARPSPPVPPCSASPTAPAPSSFPPSSPSRLPPSRHGPPPSTPVAITKASPAPSPSPSRSSSSPAPAPWASPSPPPSPSPSAAPLS